MKARKLMIRNTMLCTALCALLGGAGRASAQDEEAPGTASGDVVPLADPAAPPPTAEPGGEEAAMLPPPAEAAPASDKWARWSTRYIDRPRTLPKGLIEAGAYLDFDRYSYTVDGGTSSTTYTNLTGAVSYGVSDQLEVRATYTLTLDEFEAKGPFSVGAALGLLEGPLAVALAGDFVYDLNLEYGEIGVGARARYKVAPNLSIYSQRQLVITVISDAELKPANLRLPVGVGFQLNDQLYLYGETELAVLDLKDSQTLALFADYIPLYAGAVFSLSKKLEVGGQLYTDLKNDAFDTMSIEVLGRAYF